MELKQAIQQAFDLAETQYPSGHLTGEQIKTHLSQAMSFIDTDAAMLMNGRKISVGTFKIKEFPTDKLNRLTEPNFQSVSVPAPVAETDILGENDDKKPFDVEAMLLMTPKRALHRYGIEKIKELIEVFKVQAKDSLTDTQKTALLMTELKKKVK